MMHSSPTNPIRIDFEKRVLDCFLNKWISLEAKDHLMRYASYSSPSCLTPLYEILHTDPCFVETTFKKAQLDIEENPYEE